MGFLLKSFGSAEHQIGPRNRRMKNGLSSSLFAVAMMFCLAANLFAATGTAASADLEARRKQLNDLLAEQWEYVLRTSPEFASILGDKRYNDQVSDFSQRAIDEDLAKAKEFLTRFEAIDTAGFAEQEALNKTLMVRQLKETLDNARFKGWEM